MKNYTEYLHLAEAPVLCVNNPSCSACGVEVESDGDGWLCPSCGTSWDINSADGDIGMTYEDWSGEELTGPIISHSEAGTIAGARDAERRRELARQIYRM